MRSSVVLICGLLALLGTSGAVAQSVGVASAVNQSAMGIEPSKASRTMVIGDQVIHNEKIETDGKGLLQILLADGTSFTVGPSSSIVIDSFVYDPSANTAKVVATLGKGVFRFIGGRTSKSPDGAVLNTPVGTVGIRGGISDLDFSGHGGRPFHIDMIFGDSITLSHFGQELSRIYQSGYSIVLGPDGQHFTIVKTPPGWTESFQHALAGPGGQHGGAPHNSTTKVETAFNQTSPAPGSTPPGTTPSDPTQLADVTPPNQPVISDTTWAQINNSDLANSEATYLGQFSYTLSATGSVVPTDYNSFTGTGDFGLYYSFTEHNGGGEATFAASDGPGGFGINMEVPVGPVDANSTGAATYSGSATAYTNVPAGDSYIYGSGPFNVQGSFNNAGGVTAGATSGGFDYTAPLYQGENPDSVGTVGINGSFTGTLQPKNL